MREITVTCSVPDRLPMCRVERGKEIIPVYYEDLPFTILKGDIIHSVSIAEGCTVGI
jgi:hypothetical protein